MSFYENLRTDTARPLIARFGGTGYVLVTDVSAGDPWDPEAGELEELPVPAVRTIPRVQDRPATFVPETDAMFILAAGNDLQAPTLADRWRFDGQEYEIVSVEPVSPGQIPIIYKIHARS